MLIYDYETKKKLFSSKNVKVEFSHLKLKIRVSYKNRKSYMSAYAFETPVITIFSLDCRYIVHVLNTFIKLITIKKNTNVEKGKTL